MKNELQTCTAYVDYENLVHTLSLQSSFDIVPLLNQALERVRQGFRVQRILIFGNWTLYPMPDGVDTRGVVRRPCHDPGTDATSEIEESIAQNLAGKESSETYVLISGQAHFGQVLKRLQKAQKTCLLWTLRPAGAQQTSWSSSHFLLYPPPESTGPGWTRQVLLQAVALVTARASESSGAPLALSTWREALRSRPSLAKRSDILLSLALRERILLLQDAPDPLEEPRLSLNWRHDLCQQASLLQARILHTASLLQTKRGWVAFSTLEKRLAAYPPLSGSQHLRQQWIEVLIEQGDFQRRRLVGPHTQHATTALLLNPPATTSVVAQQKIAIEQTLIVVNDMVAHRKRNDWISPGQLRRHLAPHITLTEAQAAIEQALEQTLLFSETRPGKRNPERALTLLRLNHAHPLVHEILSRRDRLVLAAYTHLAQRDFRSSESVLLEEWEASEQIAEEEARKWLRLLVLVGLIREEPFDAQRATGEHIVYIMQDHPLLYVLRTRQEREKMEVQE